jgi:hypothetical protein
MALVSDSPAHGRSLTRVWTVRPNKRRITDNKVAQATSDYLIKSVQDSYQFLQPCLILTPTITSNKLQRGSESSVQVPIRLEASPT